MVKDCMVYLLASYERRLRDAIRVARIVGRGDPVGTRELADMGQVFANDLESLRTYAAGVHDRADELIAFRDRYLPPGDGPDDSVM